VDMAAVAADNNNSYNIEAVGNVLVVLMAVVPVLVVDIDKKFDVEDSSMAAEADTDIVVADNIVHSFSFFF